MAERFRIEDIDEPCRALVVAMNRVPGITTVESCCGHGDDIMRIFFRVRRVADLPALLFWFDSCHSGVEGWSVTVSTDCVMSPATFLASSASKGDEAYVEAAKIARCINTYAGERG